MVGSTNAPLASTPFHQQPLPVCTFHVSIMKRRKLRDTAPLFPWGKHFHMLAEEYAPLMAFLASENIKPDYVAQDLDFVEANV